MSKPLRWGVLGGAKFAREHLTPAMMLAKNTEFAALATSSIDKAASFKALNPSLRVHLNYDDLLSDPDIEAIYIPLPNHLHVEWVKKAAAAGKHVLCEKPIAMQAPQIDELIALRDSTGLLIAEAYMIVHHPQWQWARQRIDAGEIGELVQVDSIFSYNNAGDPQNIRNRPETGGGSLRDIGVYTFGAARFVTAQEPIDVHFSDIEWENSVDVWANVAAKFEGFRYSSITSMRMTNRQHVCFQGTQGSITLTAPFNAGVYDQAEVILETSDGCRTVKRFTNINQYVLQLENFYASVRQGTQYPCSLEFSKGTQQMIDHALLKAKA